MSPRIVQGLLVALLLASATAEARPPRAGTNPGPFLSFELGVHDPTGPVYSRDLVAGPAVRAVAGWRLSRYLSVEAGGFHSLARDADTPAGRTPELTEVGADVRVFPFNLDGRRFEPNLLAGYAPHATARFPGGRELAGSSASAGLGFRFNSETRFFFAMDARWRYVRFARFVAVDEQGNRVKGKCPRWLHGDGMSVTAAAGWQF